jgi:branched-chain amino acid transport system permease protein
MNRPTHRPTVLLLATALVLALLPLVLGANAIDKLTTLFIFMLLASTWGLLAGQAGLVSVGQQAFFGLGAYFALRLVDGGWTAYPALFAGAIGAAVVAWGLSFFVLRLKEGEFAIATWVIAEVIRILVMLDPIVQGETGTSLIALNAVEPELRRNYGYWMALGSLVFMLSVTAWLLRSAVGTATRAIGEDDEAAASLGVRVTPTRRWVYVLASFGAALAGVAWLASAITFLPRTNFGVQWSVLMLFMALVGGLRSQWGPLLGALLLFVLQESLGHLGAWYLAGLGAVAVVFALWLPRGLAGVWDDWQVRRYRGFQQPVPSDSVSSSSSINHVSRSSTS